MGTETLLPGSTIPLHRHLHHDEVLFVHKGQGRAILEGQTITVVPGTVLFAPRQSWHGLHNTGTGILQITWTAAPAGIEQFFRELAQSGAADPAALQALAQRHGVEFRPEAEPAGRTPDSNRRRRHRGGRGRRPSGVRAEPPTLASPSPPKASATQAPPVSNKPRPKGKSRPHQRTRIKEVYMGGRWVQVTGEGPVIASGKDRPVHLRKSTDQGNQPPAGPLTVPL